MARTGWSSPDLRKVEKSPRRSPRRAHGSPASTRKPLPTRATNLGSRGVARPTPIQWSTRLHRAGAISLSHGEYGPDRLASAARHSMAHGCDPSSNALGLGVACGWAAGRGLGGASGVDAGQLVACERRGCGLVRVCGGWARAPPPRGRSREGSEPSDLSVGLAPHPHIHLSSTCTCGRQGKKLDAAL